MCIKHIYAIYIYTWWISHELCIIPIHMCVIRIWSYTYISFPGSDGSLSLHSPSWTYRLSHCIDPHLSWMEVAIAGSTLPFEMSLRFSCFPLAASMAYWLLIRIWENPRVHQLSVRGGLPVEGIMPPAVCRSRTIIIITITIAVKRPVWPINGNIDRWKEKIE